MKTRHSIAPRLSSSRPTAYPSAAEDAYAAEGVSEERAREADDALLHAAMRPVGDDCGDGPCTECGGLESHHDHCHLLYSDADTYAHVGAAAFYGAPSR